MALDPQTQGLLEAMQDQGMKSFEQMSVSEARDAAMAFRGLQAEPAAVAAVHDRTIPGADGELPIRIFVPGGEGPLPVLTYFHGGGWVIGNLEVADKPCRALAAASGAIVVATQYRMAPETKFPGAVDDCYAALQWVAANAAEFGGDPSRLGVIGDSAGANLAAVVALKARDEGGPRIRAQVLTYPVTDATSDLPSRRENAEGYLLTAGSMDWFWRHYLREPGDGKNPYASPLLAADHSGLPPALVLTMEFDPLRDEGEAYAEKLKAAGVPVTLQRYDGLIHGTYWMTAAIERSGELYRAIAEFVRSELAVQ
ncbi:alpha/beta hydrolase [Pseudonocardia sp. KRD-184]|uniref:Alpha/beta hydrolase n=1 Tax=Pseudonocardia oceani TaxID=2792013 RepID=A0ABS6UEC4_9PSEU|nr:alpha/beta hydrolase [Pseudonocardia oceani]MBW0094489.1 alpha/beta hydrolase [Pseudonocardia oceani]MBW0107487.1 alpha/beta hydrolase [Pseudonocardia oceani]MBW0120450.1 alpha/beta hydrolase [Pseudonocardia oceani]MBW0130592.1 alpha/beta hydrolase [Pseudonocardia oceani]